MDSYNGQLNAIERNQAPVRILLSIAQRVVPVILFALAIFICFRVPILSGFDRVLGDRADGLIEISILEHWRNVFLGHAHWLETGYFYPYADTLGYNDGYFLFGVVHSVWRLYFDPFLSDTLTAATFKSIGFWGAYWLFRQGARIEWGIAVFAAFLFTITNNSYTHAGHAQLNVLALVPYETMLGILAWRAREAGRSAHAMLAGACAAILLALSFLTAYYISWFTVFFGLMFCVSLWSVSGRLDQTALRALARTHGGWIVASGIAFLIAIIPFLMVYLPKLAETGAHPYRKMLGYLVTIFDPINVGPGNYMWGWMNRLLAQFINGLSPAGAEWGAKVVDGEHSTGFPLFAFALIVLAIRRAIKSRDLTPQIRALAIAIAICWVLTIQLWYASPWGLVFYLVPGASAVRVVSRFQIFLLLPAIFLFLLVFQTRIMNLARERPVLLALVAFLLCAENLTLGFSGSLRRSVEGAAFANMPAPPATCRSFYVKSAHPKPEYFISDRKNARYPHNVDAMFLAEQFNLPTLNGFSTFNPPDWDFENRDAPDYDSRAMAYARRHHLTGVCRLDMMDKMSWRQML